MTSRVEDFPWTSLPHVSDEELGVWRAVTLRVRQAFDTRRLVAAIGAQTPEQVQLTFGQWRWGGAIATGAMATSACRVALVLPELGVRVVVVPESDLARLLLAGLLGEKYELGLPHMPLDSALQGAAAALILDLARRASTAEAPQLSLESCSAARGLVRTGTLILGGRAYQLELEASLLSRRAHSSHQAEIGGVSVGVLGAIALRIPWVAAMGWAPAAELGRLTAGDVWLPGAAWFSVERGFASPSQGHISNLVTGCLAASRGKWGWPVSGSPARFTVGAASCLIPAVSEEEVESVMSERRPQLDEVLGEAPVMVRVELGAVEMTAAQWAQLRPGDIVETAQKVGANVQLRAGGQLLAEGQLVQVDGQIGVQILSVAGVGPTVEAGVEPTVDQAPTDNPSERVSQT